MTYEYRVIPAPTKGTKAKTAKTTQDRFALTLQEAMNTMAAEGWEFQRAETLPSEERSGLTGTKTVYHNILVFRRARDSELAEFRPRPLELRAESGDQGAPAFLRGSFSATSAPSGKAPPVGAAPGAAPSPQSLSGTLDKPAAPEGQGDTGGRD